MRLSKRCSQLKPSPTLALATKAKELKAEGKDVISLSVGEPDWDTFESIKQVAINAIREGQTKYAPASGIPELRKEIASQIKQQLNVTYDSNEVTVSVGGKFILYGAFQCLLNPEDEVIIPSPYWVSYPTMVELAGGIPVIVTCDEKSQFKLTPELLKAQLTEKTRVLVLNSPSNPTGYMYTEDELKALIEVIKDYPNLIIISDDIYNTLVFDKAIAPHILKLAPDLKDRVLIVNGASKAYSMTGWRIGWALGNQDLISAMNKLQSQSVSCASPFSQIATVEAIVNCQEKVKQSVEVLKKRCDVILPKINAIEGLSVSPPDGAFYLWVNISELMSKKHKGDSILSSRDFAKCLLEAKSVVVVPGLDFGLDGYIRMSYALSEERMSEAVKRMKDFVSELEE